MNIRLSSQCSPAQHYWLILMIEWKLIYTQNNPPAMDTNEQAAAKIYCISHGLGIRTGAVVALWLGLWVSDYKVGGQASAQPSCYCGSLVQGPYPSLLQVYCIVTDPVLWPQLPNKLYVKKRISLCSKEKGKSIRTLLLFLISYLQCIYIHIFTHMILYIVYSWALPIIKKRFKNSI